MALNIPNDIEQDSDADATELQENFNAIQAFVNQDAITRDGNVAMAAALQLVGAPTQINHAANKGYVDGVNATQKTYIDSQDAKKVNLAGDVMSGALNMGGNTVSNVRDPAVPQEVATKAYADNTKLGKAGGTMTGDLVMGGPPADAPGMRLGLSPMQLAVTTGSAGDVSVNIRRGTSADANGERFIRFERGVSPGTLLGSISIATQSTVAYNTSSAAALKERVSDADDALDRVSQLGSQVYRGRWRDDDGTEWHLVNAEDVREVAPYLVQEDDEALQLNLPGLVPLLLAAVAQLAQRVAVLEG